MENSLTSDYFFLVILVLLPPRNMALDVDLALGLGLALGLDVDLHLGLDVDRDLGLDALLETRRNKQKRPIEETVI
jgi:hypothetical protein